MARSSAAALILLGLALAGLACTKSEEAKPTETQPLAPAPTVVAPAPTGPTGTIQGMVVLGGTPPKMLPLPRQSDPICAMRQVNSNFVTVGAGGGLADVLVRLPLGKAKGPVPATPVTIDQKVCMYLPHVVGAVIGQKIAITNSDPTTHNIHGYIGDETMFNEAQPPGAGAIKKSAAGEPGEVLKLTCDVHKWMESHIVMTDHPFFQVTRDDGAFTLANVPVGTYEVEAWHPHVGTLQKVSVTVEAGKTTAAQFRFQAAEYKP